MDNPAPKIQDFSKRIITNLEKVIVGKNQTLELVAVGLLCQGHLLIDDVPGVGKTVLARAIADGHESAEF